MENYGEFAQLLLVSGNAHTTYHMGCINRAPITATTINWKISDFSKDQLMTALSVYRTIQLESVIKRFYFNETSQSFTSITKEDIYRVLLGMKLADERTVVEYYLYTICRAYDSKFLIQIIVSTVTLLGMRVIAYIKRGKHYDDDINVPFTGDGWFQILRKYDVELLIVAMGIAARI